MSNIELGTHPLRRPGSRDAGLDYDTYLQIVKICEASRNHLQQGQGTHPLEFPKSVVAGTAPVGHPNAGRCFFRCEFGIQFDFYVNSPSRGKETTEFSFDPDVAGYYTLVFGYHTAARADGNLYWADLGIGGGTPDPVDDTTKARERENQVVGFPVAYATVSAVEGAAVWGDLNWAPYPLQAVVRSYSPPVPQIKVDESAKRAYWEYGTTGSPGSVAVTDATSPASPAVTTLYAGKTSEAQAGFGIYSSKDTLVWYREIGSVTMLDGKVQDIDDYGRHIQYRQPIPQVRVNESIRRIYYDHGGSMSNLFMTVPDDATSTIYVGKVNWADANISIDDAPGTFVWSYAIAEVTFASGVMTDLKDYTRFHHLTPIGDTDTVTVVTAVNVDGGGHVTSVDTATLNFEDGIKHTP